MDQNSKGTHFISLMELDDISCILFLAPFIVCLASSVKACRRGLARGAWAVVGAGEVAALFKVGFAMLVRLTAVDFREETKSRARLDHMARALLLRTLRKTQARRI